MNSKFYQQPWAVDLALENMLKSAGAGYEQLARLSKTVIDRRFLILK